MADLVLQPTPINIVNPQDPQGGTNPGANFGGGARSGGGGGGGPMPTQYGPTPDPGNSGAPPPGAPGQWNLPATPNGAQGWQTYQDVSAGRQGVAEGSWVPFQDYSNNTSAQQSGLKGQTPPTPPNTFAPLGPSIPHSSGAPSGTPPPPSPPLSPAPGPGGSTSLTAAPGAWGGFASGPGPGGFYGDALSKYLRGG